MPGAPYVLHASFAVPLILSAILGVKADDPSDFRLPELDALLGGVPEPAVEQSTATPMSLTTVFATLACLAVMFLAVFGRKLLRSIGDRASSEKLASLQADTAANTASLRSLQANGEPVLVHAPNVDASSLLHEVAAVQAVGKLMEALYAVLCGWNVLPLVTVFALCTGYRPSDATRLSSAQIDELTTVVRDAMQAYVALAQSPSCCHV